MSTEIRPLTSLTTLSPALDAELAYRRGQMRADADAWRLAHQATDRRRTRHPLAGRVRRLVRRVVAARSGPPRVQGPTPLWR